MIKAFIFVFGGTAAIYFSCFGDNKSFHLPTLTDVADQYEIKKIKNENIKLKLQLQKAEFTLARLQESDTLKKEMNRAVASSDKKFEILPESKKIQDFVKQEVYHWSPVKLLALAEKEYKLKNHIAAAQFGMTLLNEDLSNSHVDENFYYRLGVSCVESKHYLSEGITVLGELIKKYPDSTLVVQAKLWRGLAYHRLNNKTEFLAMMEEFKVKYRNTKEWTVLKNIYERSIASGKENQQEGKP